MDERMVADCVAAYRRAWESNHQEEVGALVAEDARSFTEPFAKPTAGREAIVRDWLDRRDEPGDTEFRLEAVDVAPGAAFVRAWTRYRTDPPRQYHNLWVIRLDGEGRCSEFTEWWMRVDEPA